MTRLVRPDLLQLWPAWAAFPIVALAVLALGLAVGDGILMSVGLALLIASIVLVVDYLYFTTLGVEGDLLVFRTHFGLQQERVPVGAIQRIDAKRYPAAHSGVSAPNFVVRGRASMLKVNTRPYRLTDLRALSQTLRGLNPAIQFDAFWSAVLEGRDPEREAQRVPRSRW